MFPKEIIMAASFPHYFQRVIIMVVPCLPCWFEGASHIASFNEDEMESDSLSKILKGLGWIQSPFQPDM